MPIVEAVEDSSPEAPVCEDIRRIATQMTIY
jgi:hypothetical protein